MYPDGRVASLIASSTVPVRSHVKETPQLWGRFTVRWSPTVLLLDSRGREAFRLEGYLPSDEFLGQIELGLGYVAAGEKDWPRAEQHFSTIVDKYPDTDAAPAALYWRGAARYSANHDAGELQATAQAFLTRYRDSAWAKRSVVWLPQGTKGAAA